MNQSTMNQSVPINPLSLNQAGAGQHLTANQAPLQDSSHAQVDAMQQRIAFLEKELVDTRLQLACSKSSEDSLKMELSKMSSAFAKFAAGDNRGGDCDGWLSGPSCSMPLSGEVGDENMQENAQPRHFTAPTANPFLRRGKATTGKATVRRARKTSLKALNPGSCSSGLDLLALAELSNSGSMASLARPRSTRRANLNPDSCASGLDLLAGLNETSLRTMPSATGLLRRSNSRSSNSRLARGSNASLISALGGTGVSGNNITVMLGNARLMSNSSFSRRQGSRSNVRISNRSAMTQGNANSNAEWGVFGGR